MSPFILGLQSGIHGRAFLDTKVLYDQVGANTGNLAFHEAIDSHLGGRLPVVPWGQQADVTDSAGDIGIIPSANQLGPHANYGGLAQNFSQLKCRLVSIGLGAQSGVNGEIPVIPEGTIEWVKQIGAHGKDGVPNITVRGDFTKKVLQHYGLDHHAVVMGCPTLFINRNDGLGELIAKNVKKIERVAVAAGHQGWRHLAKIEASLAGMVTACGGSYVAQSPLAMVQLARGEARAMDKDELSSLRDYACPSMSIEEFALWSERHGNVFFDIPSWMEHYRRFDFVIGARIHGVMLALQAGVPAVCIAHDSRTRELCETMLVPYVLSSEVSGGISRDQLLDLFKFDAAAFDANRREIALRYNEFLRSNDLNPVKWLSALAGS